jgi:hypothetical protein
VYTLLLELGGWGAGKHSGKFLGLVCQFYGNCLVWQNYYCILLETRFLSSKPKLFG